MGQEKYDDRDASKARHPFWRRPAWNIAWLAVVGALAMNGLAGSPCKADTAVGLDYFRHGRFAEAFEAWQRDAAAGDARGALFVGVLYDTGLGVPRDDERALAWYRRAAEAGSAAGAFNVGIMYDAGRGAPQNAKLAAGWYARAAAKNFPRAEYNLAMMYEAGTGVARDPGRAIQLYEKAASHGITAARAHLTALGRPVGGVQRPAEDTGMRDFQQAQQMLLARGSAEASGAVALFRRAAAQHSPLAEYNLGYCFEHGLGVPLDLVEAAHWYRLAVADAASGPVHDLAQAGAQSLARAAAPGSSPLTPVR